MSSLVQGTPTLDPFEFASQVVRDYTKITFDHVTGDVEVLDPRTDGSVQLSQTPVLAVQSVEGWMPGQTGVWDWQPITWYRWLDRGLLYNTANIEYPVLPTWGPTWPWVPGSVRVTYDHGYVEIPDDIQGVVTRLAAQIAANPKWIQSRKVGEVSTVFSTADVPLRDVDKVILDGYAVQETS